MGHVSCVQGTNCFIDRWQKRSGLHLSWSYWISSSCSLVEYWGCSWNNKATGTQSNFSQWLSRYQKFWSYNVHMPNYILTSLTYQCGFFWYNKSHDWNIHFNDIKVASVNIVENRKHVKLTILSSSSWESVPTEIPRCQNLPLCSIVRVLTPKVIKKRCNTLDTFTAFYIRS